MKKRALVTGGTGFVGANLVRRLVRDGHEAHLLVRPGYRDWRIADMAGDITLHELDMVDATATRRVVTSIRPDWIFHLAVHGAYSYQNDPREMIATNIISTLNLLEAGLECGFEAFVNTGSSSEYGATTHAPAESDLPEPNSYYAVTKVSATMLCQHLARVNHANVVTLRLYSAYGPYEEPTRLIPTLIRHGLKGELPPLVNPDIARDFVFVEDLVDAFLLAATVKAPEPGAIYNVGTGQQTTLRELVEVATEIMNIPVQPEWGSMENRAWDTTVWVADPRKIQQEIGWRPASSLRDGLSRTAAWIEENTSLHTIYGIEE